MTRSLSVQPKYLQQVNLAWKRKSAGREQDLAQELGRSLPIVINNLFLKGQPVNQLNFIEICELLELDWREVAGLPSHESSISPIEEALDSLASTLCEMLRRVTRKARDLLGADRASIFLLDPQRKELGSLLADDGKGGTLIIEIPSDRGFASLAATSLQVINIPFDAYDDLRSEEAKKTDKKTGYRTYTVLAYPLLNTQRNLVAVVQLINKLKPGSEQKHSLIDRIDTNGFTKEDEAIVAKFIPSILRIIERCQSCYILIQELQNTEEHHHTNTSIHRNKLVAKLRKHERQLRNRIDRI